MRDDGHALTALVFKDFSRSVKSKKTLYCQQQSYTIGLSELSENNAKAKEI